MFQVCAIFLIVSLYGLVSGLETVHMLNVSAYHICLVRTLLMHCDAYLRFLLSVEGGIKRMLLCYQPPHLNEMDVASLRITRCIASESFLFTMLKIKAVLMAQKKFGMLPHTFQICCFLESG